MKRLLPIMALSFVMTITVHAQTDGDSIATQTPEVAPSAIINIVQIPSWVPQGRDDTYLAVYDAFPDAPVMAKIAQAESQYNPTNKNPSSSAKGLFQIIDGTWKNYHCTGSPYNAQDNIACAQKIYADNGTSQWKSSKGVWSKLV